MLTGTDTHATLQARIAARFAGQIRANLLGAGSRLPSVRGCARQFGVSPQTVVAAYEMLQAQGLVDSAPRRGFFVRTSGAPPTRGAPLPQLPPPRDATALMRGMFAQMHQPGALRAMPGAGTLPAAWLQSPAPARALRRLLRGEGFDTLCASYGDPAGDPPLREALSALLADNHVRAPSEQIITCGGATHALDLVTRAFTMPGDAVMVEQPGWSAQFAQLAQAGVDLLPVPRGDDGPDLDRVEHWARTRKPRLMFVVSRLHNPTGGQLHPAHAHRLLRLAHEHDFLLVEDDVYGALCEQPAPLLAAMDGLARTLQVGGMSKLLLPGWRVGWIAASPAHAERLTDAKLLSCLTTPTPTERAMAELLGASALRGHAQRLREKLARARKQAGELAMRHGCRFVTPPRGMFGWVDTGVDADALAQRLFAQGFLLAPGRLFDPAGAPTSCMRLNFAHGLDPAFWRAFAAARAELGG